MTLNTALRSGRSIVTAPPRASSAAAEPASKGKNASKSKGKGKDSPVESSEMKRKPKKKRAVFSLVSYIPKVAETIEGGTSTSAELGATINGILIQSVFNRLVQQVRHCKEVARRKSIGLAQVRGGFAALLNEAHFDEVNKYASHKVGAFAIHEDKLKAKRKLEAEKKKEQAASGQVIQGADEQEADADE